MIITAVAVIVSAVILAVTTAEKSNVAGLDSIFGSPRTTARGRVPVHDGGRGDGPFPATFADSWDGGGVIRGAEGGHLRPTEPAA